MENSIITVKKKTKFDLPVAIVTSVDAVLVLVAAVLLSLTFFRVISSGHQVEVELDTFLKKDGKTAVCNDPKEKNGESQISGCEFTFSPASPWQRV